MVYKRKKHSILLCFLVAGRRIELRTSWLWIMRSNQLSYPAMTFCQYFVEIEGLEPSLTEPESVVLPLHHISIWLPFLNLGLQRYECFAKFQKFFVKNSILLWLFVMSDLWLTYDWLISSHSSAYDSGTRDPIFESKNTGVFWSKLTKQVEYLEKRDFFGTTIKKWGCFLIVCLSCGNCIMCTRA